MSQRRDDVAVIAPNRQHRSAGRIRRLNGFRMVVEATQLIFSIALDVRRVGRAPVHARSRVSEQMERRAAERIASFAGDRTCFGQRHAELRVRLSRDCDHLWIVSGQRHTLAIVDGSARHEPDEVQHARVVFEPSSSVGLSAEMRPDDVVVGMDDLYVDRHGKKNQRNETERGPDPGDRDAERLEIARRVAVGVDRRQHSQRTEVRDHRRPAVAQKRRHDARERRHPKDARRHDQRGYDQEQRESRGEEKAVVVSSQPSDANAAPRENRVQDGNEHQPCGAKLLSYRSEDEIRVAGR